VVRVACVQLFDGNNAAPKDKPDSNAEVAMRAQMNQLLDGSSMTDKTMFDCLYRRNAGYPNTPNTCSLIETQHERSRSLIATQYQF